MCLFLLYEHRESPEAHTEVCQRQVAFWAGSCTCRCTAAMGSTPTPARRPMSAPVQAGASQSMCVRGCRTPRDSTLVQLPCVTPHLAAHTHILWLLGVSEQVPWVKGGVGDADYLAAWDLVLGPIARAFAPQVQPVTCCLREWLCCWLPDGGGSCCWCPPLRWWCARAWCGSHVPDALPSPMWHPPRCRRCWCRRGSTRQRATRSAAAASRPTDMAG